MVGRCNLHSTAVPARNHTQGRDSMPTTKLFTYFSFALAHDPIPLFS